VTVNGRHAAHGAGLDTRLSDGDVVRLTTAIYGG
jgi:molybdopterin converting factor small subunit